MTRRLPPPGAAMAAGTLQRCTSRSSGVRGRRGSGSGCDCSTRATGSRSDRAAGAATVERARETLGPDVEAFGAENADSVAGAEVVAVTVPFAGMVEIYDVIAPALQPGQVVLDATSPLMSAVGGRRGRRSGRGTARPPSSPRRLPDGVPVVAGFHTVGAHTLALEGDIDSDTLLCADDDTAKRLVGGLIESIPGMRWVDAGPLATPGSPSRSRRWSSRSTVGTSCATAGSASRAATRGACPARDLPGPARAHRRHRVVGRRARSRRRAAAARAARGPGLDHHEFADYLDPLTEGGIRLVLVDQRACGRSGGPRRRPGRSSGTRRT